MTDVLGEALELSEGGQHLKAEGKARRALTSGSGGARARSALLNILQRHADFHLRRDDPKAAAFVLRRALRLAPRDRATLDMSRAVERRRAELAANRAESERPSRRAPRRRRPLAPGEPETALSRANSLYLAGEIDGARARLAEALARGRGQYPASQRFAALMKLGRHREAVAVAESTLDGVMTLPDLRAFSDPWEWNELWPRRKRVELAGLEQMSRMLGADNPWVIYYRADLLDPEKGLLEYERLDEVAGERYSWMLIKAGGAALTEGRFKRAVAWLKSGLKSCAFEWRARCLLAEAHLCLGRRGAAFAETARALAAAKEHDVADALAWRGELHLWVGQYEEALRALEEACRLGAKHAFAWRGAALLKLGRHRLALRQLNEALRLVPSDSEAYIWRAETKRELGLFEESLADLKRPELVRRESTLTWALFNRALVKKALGDRKGWREDYLAIPAFVRAHLVERLGARSSPEAVLRAGLRLSRGFRRDEYRQAVWMRASGT